MPKAKRDPIRCFQGDAEPYAPFWTWSLQNSTESDPDPEPELEFYGFISEYAWWEDDITPKKFKDDLMAHGQGGPITIRINSGGGEVVAASVIRSILVDYPGQKTVRIDGLCASAAVMVAISGDVIKVQDSAYMMVHNPGYSFLFGYMDAQVLLEIASHLELIKSGILDAYQSRTGLSLEQLSEMLDAETWMTAAQAVEFGFADEVITNSAPATTPASVENALRNYVNVPPALLNVTSQAVELKSQAVDEETEQDAPPTSDDAGQMQAQRLREDVQQFMESRQAGPKE